MNITRADARRIAYIKGQSELPNGGAHPATAMWSSVNRWDQLTSVEARDEARPYMRTIMQNMVAANPEFADKPMVKAFLV